MPNRFSERKRIVLDDEDGPVTPTPGIKQQQHDPSNQQQLQAARHGVNGRPPFVNRAYPPQKPFYFGKKVSNYLALSLVIHY